MRLDNNRNPGPRAVDRRLARTTVKQHGLITRDQALAQGATAGMIRWRLETGVWTSLHAGVYAAIGYRPTWHQRLLGACLYWGPDAYASHRAAGMLWKLPGFSQNLVELTVPTKRDRAREGVVIHRSEPLSGRDRAIIDDIPVTGMARTLIDLAGVALRDGVEEALDDALVRELVTPTRIRNRLDALGRRRGAGVMRALLEARDPAHGVPESVFETRMLRVTMKYGLPPPLRQFEVRDGSRLVALLDFAWPDERVGVETDGYRWHAKLDTWERDRRRDFETCLLDWRIRRVTWDDLLHREDEVVAWIKRARER